MVRRCGAESSCGRARTQVRGKSTVPVQWHQDKVDLPCPPELDAMYMLRVPRRGGVTLFASAAAAVDALPAERLAFLESLDCEHRRGAFACVCEKRFASTGRRLLA